MTGAMYSAVSGLKAHMSAMNVIGNNISNVNTTAYKATRFTFSEALYTTVRNGSNGTDQMGGINPAQVGYGASLGTIDIDVSTKNYSPTGMAMDCMIDGDGFFLVGDDKTNTGITSQSKLQGMSLSRMGNFQFDANGYLVDGNGSLVYGFLQTSTQTDTSTAPTALNPDATPYFAPVLTPIRLPMCEIVQNAATGGSDTKVYLPTVNNVTDDKTNPPSTSSYIVDASIKSEGGAETLTRMQGLSISIDKTGAITAMTKDEQLVVVGYVALAQVDSPNGVTHVDGRYFQALGGAGTVRLTTVGESVSYIAGGTSAEGMPPINSSVNVEGSGDTELVPGGLESSGTDLATEISNMIVIQRGYQANTRIVTVTDSMLEELVNMKR